MWFMPFMSREALKLHSNISISFLVFLIAKLPPLGNKKPNRNCTNNACREDNDFYGKNFDYHESGDENHG